VVVTDSIEDLKKQFEELLKSVEDKKYDGPKVEVKDIPEQPIGKVIRKP
jgi:hypothetical protein